MDKFDRGCNIDYIFDPLATEREIGKQRDHRANALAAAVHEVCGNVREIALTGTDRANQALFDQCKFLGNAAERVICAAQQRRPGVGSGNAGGLDVARFTGVNQRDSGPWPQS